MPTELGLKYLNAAREAVSYVRMYVPYGSANNVKEFATLDPDKLVRQLRAMDRLLATRNAIDQEEPNHFIDEKDNLRKAQLWAAQVMKKHGGNCGEQSALAFEFLRHQGIKPLDWAHFINRDHAFVIIGRPSESEVVGNPPREWALSAVICDPWKNRSGFWMDMKDDYPPSQVGTNLFYNPSMASLSTWVNK